MLLTAPFTDYFCHITPPSIPKIANLLVPFESAQWQCEMLTGTGKNTKRNNSTIRNRAGGLNWSEVE